MKYIGVISFLSAGLAIASPFRLEPIADDTNPEQAVITESGDSATLRNDDVPTDTSEVGIRRTFAKIFKGGPTGRKFTINAKCDGLGDNWELYAVSDGKEITSRVKLARQVSRKLKLEVIPKQSATVKLTGKYTGKAWCHVNWLGSSQ